MPSEPLGLVYNSVCGKIDYQRFVYVKPLINSVCFKPFLAMSGSPIFVASSVRSLMFAKTIAHVCSARNHSKMKQSVM